jgi:RNA polymerase sigma-54 factor
VAMRLTLSARQVQTLALTPALRQSLHVLRLSSADLADEIAHELAVNPFLVSHSVPTLSTPLLDAVHDQAAGPASVFERVNNQLSLMSLPNKVAALALYLAGELTEEGYLTADIGDELTARGITLDLFDQALDALQSCDPPGIGARSLAECLNLQLQDKGLSAPEAAAIVANLSHFARGAYRVLAGILDLSEAEVAQRAALLRSLSARPIEPTTETSFIGRTDLAIERAPGGKLEVTLSRGTLPDIGLDVLLIKRATDLEFGVEYLARAEALLAALAYRGTTLKQIGTYLVEHQHAFFTQGPDHLRPLTRATLAESLKVHPSTISRAVAGKSLDAFGRVWPMSVFFSSALPGVGNKQISAFVIQRKIASMIAGETGSKPLSDDTITQRLCAEGVDIARRTVAKYRKGLRIPSSAERRRAVASA